MRWEVVGFEVMPCSIKRLKPEGEPLKSFKCRPWGDPRNPEPQVCLFGTVRMGWCNIIDWFAGTP